MIMPFVEWLEHPDHGFYVRDNWDWEKGTFKKGGKIELPRWMYRVLDHCLTPDDDDNFPYETIVLGWLKKSGKTAILAAAFAWFGEVGPRYCEIYATASDLLHAQNRAFDDFRHHQNERGNKCYKGHFVFEETESTIEALAKEFKSASGSRPALVGWDELWCVAEGTKVLRGDMLWVPAENLNIGDEVLSFEEERTGHYRSFKSGRVISTGIEELPAVRVMLQNGEQLVVTPNHRWLAKRGQRNHIEWIRSDELRRGDQLLRAMPVWETGHTYGAGYIAAALDGEGCLSLRSGKGFRLDFVQKDNEMLELMRDLYNAHNIRYFEPRPRGTKNLMIGQKHEVMRVLGTFRPRRLLAKVDFNCLGRLQAYEYVKVDEVLLDEDPCSMVTLGTDCGTYLAEGFCAHNTYTTERDHRMWDEMTPPPTVKSPLRIVVTYAGFEDESDLLWELYEQNFLNGEPVPELIDLVDDIGNPVCKRAGKTFIMWDSVPRMPWQTEEYYTEQARTLPAHQFVRYHKNQWVTTAEEFIPIKWYDRACTLDGQLRYRLDDKYRTFPIFVSVDVAPKYDCCAASGVWHDPVEGRLGLAFHKIWKPPGDGSDIDLEETVEKFLLEMNEIFSIASVVYDPTQFVRSAATLRKKGMVMIEVPQTATNMIACSECLFDLMRENSLDLYYDDECREHFKFARSKITERGVRLYKDIKDSSKDIHKTDFVVSLAMGVWHATNVGGVDTTQAITIESPFGDVSHITYKTEAQKKADLVLPEELRD